MVQGFYFDSEILENKLGIKDAEELNRYEYLLSRAREIEFMESGKMISFNLQGLKEVHRHLFQDVYVWAGDLRQVNISKEGNNFCKFDEIGWVAKEIFENFKEEKNLQGLSQNMFSERASQYFSEVNVLHPFLEGNGRTQRLFFSVLAQQAGYPLDWDKVSKEKYLDAVKAAFCKNQKELGRIFQIISSPTRPMLSASGPHL